MFALLALFAGVRLPAYVLSVFVLMFLRQKLTIVHGNLNFCFYDFDIFSRGLKFRFVID